ncbi:MAG: ATP-binding cassette domain-containing protein [Candidatus Promineifilaceae bacterium]
MNWTRAFQHETVVEVGGAGVKRGGRWLVEGVDLTIRRGEIVTLIGPNGSGKSTTAKHGDRGAEARRRARSSAAPALTVGYVPQKLSHRLDACR